MAHLLGITNNKFYMGLTASTSSYTQDLEISNLKIETVIPSAAATFAQLSPSNLPSIKSNEYFVIDFYVQDSCKNRYVPIDSDSINDISWVVDTSSNCLLRTVNIGSQSGFAQSGPSYQVYFSCSQVGEKTIQLNYKEKSISNVITVKIVANVMTRAKTNIMDQILSNNLPNIDKGFDFSLNPLDNGDNLAVTTSEDILNKVSVVWENPADTRKDHIVTLNPDGSYNFHINTDKAGDYNISSTLFLNEIDGGSYIVVAIHGAPNANNSFAIIYDATDPNNLLDFEGTKVNAGQNAKAIIHLKDRLNNTITMNNAYRQNSRFSLFENGAENALDKTFLSQDILQMSLSFIMTVKGPNMFVAYYGDEAITCLNCIYTINPLESVFSKADLFVYNTTAKNYVANKNSAFLLQKADKFNFLMVLKDKFNNVLDNINAKDYTAELSGNLMKPIALLLTPYTSNGLQVLISDSDYQSYQNLVGRENYAIKITETASKTTRTFSLTLVSDGADSDASNGDLVPVKTQITWAISPLNNKCTVGDVYRVAVKLVTATGARYNGWLNESSIVGVLDVFYAKDGETLYGIRKDLKPGMYLMDLMLTKASGKLRTLSYKVNNISVLTKLRFYDIATIPNQAFVDNSTVLQMKSGVVLKKYAFTYSLYDKYMNPVDPSSSTLDLVLRLDKQPDLGNLKPNCDKNGLGVYLCSFTPNIAGNYTLNSQFFLKNYYITIEKGSPDASFTEGGVVNDVTQHLLAGTTISFRLLVKDQQGSQLNKGEVAKYVMNFNVTMMFIDENQLFSLPITDGNVAETGEIRVNKTLTKTGYYKFLPTYDQIDVKCSICAVNIEANLVDVSKVKISLLQGDSSVVLKENTTVLLDNNRIVPSFLMEFFDYYENKRNIESNFSNFEGNLLVPSSDFLYKFTGNSYMGNIVFVLDSDENKEKYQQELSSFNCNLTFVAVSVSDQRRINKYFNVSLKGSEFDDQFTYDDPDPENILMIPSQISSIAGQFFQISVELRAKNGKLFYDQENHGFYPDSLKAFTLIPEGENTNFPLQITKGKLNGTYVLSSNVTKAYYSPVNVYLSYANHDNHSAFTKAKNPLILTVNPATPEFLTVKDAKILQRDCVADTRKVVFCEVFDHYSNKIYNAEIAGLGLSFTQENKLILPSLSQNSEGVSSVMLCKTVGKVTFSSISFRTSGASVENYTFSIIPGAPDPMSSLALLNINEIKAGETAEWRIFPSDLYGNKISIEKTATFLANFSSSLIRPNSPSSENITVLNVSDDGSYLVFASIYDTAGRYSFQAYFNNLLVFSSNFVLKVLPLEGSWEKSRLSVLESKTGLFNEYDKDEVIVQSIFAYPEFKVNIYDSKGNSVVAMPDSWDLSVRLFELDMVYPIVFCSKAEDPTVFFMCEDNSHQDPSLAKTPKTRWEELVQNKTYQMSTNYGKFFVFSGYLNVTGNDSDSGTSNLPLDINNTLITPSTSLITEAGVLINFFVELRTTNKNLRPNWFYEDPNINISFTFSQDNDKQGSSLRTVVSRGETHGKYRVTLLSYKTYLANNANVITLSFNNVKFMLNEPVFIVNPGEIHRIQAFDTEKNEIVDNLPQKKTADFVYSAFFKASDTWNNDRPLTQEDLVRISLVFSDDSSINFERKITGSGLLSVNFQPKLAGNYTYILEKGGNFTFEIVNGEASDLNSFGTVNISSNSSIKAGEFVEVSVYFSDKWGNPIGITQEILKKLYVKYYYRRPDVTEGYIVGNSSAEILANSTNSLRFLQQVTVKGLYSFKISIKDLVIPMRSSTVKVVPSEVSLANSNLRYYDTDASRYLLMSMLNAIKEDNMHTSPSYTLELADSFGNTYETFPSEIIDKIPFVIFGNDFDEALNPLRMNSSFLLGNSLFANISDAETASRYQGAVYRDKPYSLRITLETTNETVIYPIVLLGQGLNDSDAESEQPLNLSFTVLSKSSLSFKAGEFDSFIVELRDINNKRKVDIKPVFSFKFEQKDGLSDGKFSAFALSGDLRGKFLITVSGTKANVKLGATILSLLVDGAEIPQKILCNVLPNSLQKLEIPTNLSALLTTDNTFSFDVFPYDKYENLVEVQESDVNLLVKYPGNRSSYTTTKDLLVGKLVYSVSCRDSGIYIIQSPLLDSPKNFSVLPGKPSADTSSVYVDPISLVVGENVTVYIIAIDANNNRISPVKTPEISSLFSLKVQTRDQFSSYSFEIDAKNDRLFARFTSILSGVSSLTPSVNSLAIGCENCSVVFRPGPLDVSQTKFYSHSNGDSFIETSTVQISYGSTRLSFIGFLYDKYSNPIASLNSSETFQMTLSGNNMGILSLSVSTQNPNILLFDLNTQDSPVLSRIVPFTGYSLNLTYLLDENPKGSDRLTLEVIGQDNGAGNGEWTWAQIDPLPTLKLVAGVEGFFKIVLFTDQNRRFNGGIDPATVKIYDNSDAEHTSNETLSMKVYPGDANGKISLGFLGKISISQQRQKNITFSVNGTTVNQKLFIYIVPNVPDLMFTNVTTTLTASSVSGVQQTVTLLFFDAYYNAYPTAGLTDKVFASVQKGSANFSATISQNEYTFVVPITPIYPPSQLQIMIFYKWSDSIIYPILSTPLTTYVYTYLDPLRTEIIGTSLPGISTGQEFKFYVLLKDKAGHCFEENRNVSVNISGPFVVNVKNPLASVFTLSPVYMNASETGMNSSKLTNTTYACQKLYYGYLQPETLQKEGFYKIEAFIEGELNGNAVKNINYTYVTPGPTAPERTLLSVPALANRGRTPLDLEVNTPILFKLQLADKFGNVLSEIRSATQLSVQLTDFDYNDYKLLVTNNTDGSYSLNLTVQKTGTVKALLINLNGNDLKFEDLQKSDVPDSIEITPGPCAASKVFIENAVFLTANVTVGEANKFTLQCRDQFENVITRGGELFQTIMAGSNLEVVLVDYGQSVITDENNGNYTYNFQVAWAGNYTITLTLSAVPVGETFYIFATRSRCNDKKIYCENINICAESYFNCNYEFFKDCSEKSKPYRCNVNGVPTCVAGNFECDCPEDFFKCPIDNKCVPWTSVDILCSTFIYLNCPSESPAICPSGFCRVDLSNCPSQPGCPPGYSLCADQTCALTTTGCKDFTSQDYDCLLKTEPWKCEDQSCVSDPTLCPTRITCSNPSYVICPDKTCKASELECNPPATCPGMYLCPDQSCRPSRDDCPRAITCPNGYALCEDKTCRTNCNNAVSRRMRMLLNLKDSNTRSLQDTVTVQECAKDYYVCPGGECVSNTFLCPSVQSCGPNKRVCPDFSCAGTNERCVMKSCSDNQLLCWDGKCVDSTGQCSTRTTCPVEYPIKCVDGSCSKNATACPEDIKCPAYYPYRCATGECRANQKECPTLITCPANKPIQCTDGSCVTSPFNCLNITLLRKCDYNEMLCPDGSCALSKLLCPPIASCNPSQIRCWDNTCVNNITDCDPLEPTRDVCPNDKKLRCPDGSCRASLKDCPTQLICPVTRPVKCDDGTCKQSIQQCALGTECGYGLKRCPDGSCTSNENLCGTPVTCSRVAPYICFDGTCKKDPRDCPAPPACSQSVPILCPDGTCTSQRVNCKRLGKCDAKTPVRCPNMNCYASVDDCNAIDGCPAGKVMCEDGSCASYVSYCPSKKCPDHLSLKCPDGLCVNDLKLCDDNSTGCPYSKPYKCPDGQCSVNSTKCLNPNATCLNGYFLCPDGSCAISNSSCLNIFGCPWESPMFCASGECIDPSKGSCPVASCPKETPVKCMDGLCANSITTCPSFFTAVEISQCFDDPKGNMIPCADGRCVTSSELCRPLFKCPTGKVRCGDGSCRSMQALCPLINSTCPKERSVRCNIGACAASQDDCPNANNGCPLKAPVKCSNTGSCMKAQSDCETFKNRTILLNNCSLEKPFLCHNESSLENRSYCVSSASRCVKSISQCLSTQVKCPNGLCAANVSLCTANCPIFTCPNGACGNDRSDCLAENGCPLHTPFLCNDGTCKQSPLAINGEKGCLPNLVCPAYKPYLCSNGECQGAPSQCQVQKPCPEENPFQCPDYSCATDAKDCYGQILCPIATPILCGSGRCEKTPMECLDSATNPMYCPDERPVLCASGQCEKYAWNCTDKDTRTGNMKQARRLLLEADSIALVVCSDGSFRTKAESCVIIPSCQPGQYRCNSSACVDRIQDCPASELLISACASGSVRCLDGICREKCLEYQGCPFEKNYHCGNGLCAKNEGECAGDSVCQTGSFRCIDNRCVDDARSCSTPLRNYLAENLKITVSPLMTTSINFIQQGTSSIKLATLTLPAGALLPNQQNITNSSFNLAGLGLMIDPVAHSKIINYTTAIDPTRVSYVEKIFPYNAGYIGFHQTVRAPIVSLQTINRPADAYKFPLLLEISADVLTNTNKAEDYCLATINNYTTNWECVSRQLLNSDDVTSNKFAYPVPQDGIYTVVFSPEEKIEASSAEGCGWFCQNKWTILYVFIAIIVAGLIGSYVIWRISRYVNKYKAAKKQMANFREQINEMEKAKTDVLGQTLRDKIEGISFTTNPAFRKESSASNLYSEGFLRNLNFFKSREGKRKEIIGLHQ